MQVKCLTLVAVWKQSQHLPGQLETAQAVCKLLICAIQIFQYLARIVSIAVVQVKQLLHLLLSKMWVWPSGGKFSRACE